MRFTVRHVVGGPKTPRTSLMKSLPISSRRSANTSTPSRCHFRLHDLFPIGNIPAREILFRLIDKKGVFEWRQGVLVSWDGTAMRLLVNGQPKDFKLSPD